MLKGFNSNDDATTQEHFREGDNYFSKERKFYQVAHSGYLDKKIKRNKWERLVITQKVVRYYSVVFDFFFNF